MTIALTPGTGIFFMRVGTHAEEPLDRIVERKLKEIDRTGHAFWGYGGNTCHPTSIVQPFAEQLGKGGSIPLYLEEMESHHFGLTELAAEYSIDGVVWQAIPSEIEVRGSRYALVISNLRIVKETLPLEQTEVAIGPSQGRNGSRYLKDPKVDKACLAVLPPERAGSDKDHRKITLMADIVEPYAVFLRDFR